MRPRNSPACTTPATLARFWAFYAPFVPVTAADGGFQYALSNTCKVWPCWMRLGTMKRQQHTSSGLHQYVHEFNSLLVHNKILRTSNDWNDWKWTAATPLKIVSSHSKKPYAKYWLDISLNSQAHEIKAYSKIEHILVRASNSNILAEFASSIKSLDFAVFKFIND